ESFEPQEQNEALVSRLEIVGRHATTALYNAVEMRRIPLGWLWRPIAKVQDGLGGKAKAITTAIVAAVLITLLALIVVPWPLKMEANGQLVPVERAKIYPPRMGHIEKFLIEPN